MEFVGVQVLRNGWKGDGDVIWWDYLVQVLLSLHLWVSLMWVAAWVSGAELHLYFLGQ